MKKVFITSSILILVVILLISSFFAFSESVDVRSGRITYANLFATGGSTSNWGAFIVNATPGGQEGTLVSANLSYAGIYPLEIPSQNLKDGDHYYVAMIPDEFTFDLVENVTWTDFEDGGMFNGVDFPGFLNNYDTLSDNAYKTFYPDGNPPDGVSDSIIQLGGINFSAVKMTLYNTNVNYYILKYKNATYETPIFLVEIGDYTCYDGSDCNAEFLLPRAEIGFDYHFFGINKYVSYDYDVWIDGVQTKIFPQTALAYDVIIHVYNSLTLESVSNVSVVIGEEDGYNMFLPYTLSGYVADAYTVGRTDENGLETFLIAPTKYGDDISYNIYVGVVKNNKLTNKELINVSSYQTTVQQSKQISNSLLSDNVKVNVNRLNQIRSALFKWVDNNKYHREIIQYDLDTGTFDNEPLILQTGVPNQLMFFVTSSGVSQSGYTINIKEDQGHLLLNPYDGSSPLSEKGRIHMNTLPTDTYFIVTPTSLSTVQSNVSIEIIDSAGNLVDTLVTTINSSLNYNPIGVVGTDDLLKTRVNVMAQLLSSIFYSINN